MNINYEKQLNRIISDSNGRKPSLLLHCCCGPCSSSVLEFLNEYFDIQIFWYNPNIFPEAEHDVRYANLILLIQAMRLDIPVIKVDYDHAQYLKAIQGHESSAEGGARCADCFALRLNLTAEYAAGNGFDYFCTTLTLSRHKNALLINRLGAEAAEMHSAVWLPSDFKKKNREGRSLELCEEYGIYRQLYCGCEFSLKKMHSGENAAEVDR